MGQLEQEPRPPPQAMFSGMGLAPGQQGPEGLDNLLPMMEGMMQSLLSKELLYPAMKELADKVQEKELEDGGL